MSRRFLYIGTLLNYFIFAPKFSKWVGFVLYYSCFYCH